MTDAPEKIIAHIDYDGTVDGTWVDAGIPMPPPFDLTRDAEYIRADVAAAEIARLREALERIGRHTQISPFSFEEEPSWEATIAHAALDKPQEGA